MNNPMTKGGGENTKYPVGLSSDIFPVDLRAEGVDINPGLRLKLYNGSITTTHTTWQHNSGRYVGDSGIGEHILKKDDISKQFNLSSSDIVKAIIQKKTSVIERAQDPNFRFPSNVGGELINASDLSEAFAILLATTRSDIAKKGAAKSNKRRGNKADEYAKKMYKVLEDIKAEKGHLTLRATIEILKDRGFDPPTKGKDWHPGTLHALSKRWENLGLTASQPKLK